jgi:recombination protein U
MNYPNNIKKKINNPLSYKNRGMDLEDELNISNNYYISSDKALIYKKPTPIGIANVSYNSHGKTIEKAYFKEQSTLDYNGLYRGKYIEFEAKVTKNKTSFPLENIHEHQIKHIASVIRHKGIVFLIIKINDLVYLLKGEDFIDFINSEKRKSIPYNYIKEKGYLIKYDWNPLLNYLSIVDKIYFKEEDKYE